MGLFRAVVAIALIVLNTGIFLAAVCGTALPLATFSGSGSYSGYVSLWQNCSVSSSDCHSFDWRCQTMKTRIEAGRAFTVLNIIFSFFSICCAIAALVFMICLDNIDSAAAAIRGSIYSGVLVLIWSVVAMALALVINAEPLCDVGVEENSFKKLNGYDGWVLGEGVVALVAAAAFSLISSCFGKMMEHRITTSKLGVN